MDKIVLIDGHSILNRAFYGVPPLTNSEGLHTNAVFGFLSILFKLLEEEKPQYLVVAFDVKAKTFRHALYSEYKGTRKGMPQELHEQVPIMKQVLQAMDILIIEMEGFEADDVLGTIAKSCEQKGLAVSLISGDRDMLQLASERIKIRIPKTKAGKTEIVDYNAKEVMEQYQVTPSEFIDVKALMGDASDNIPGLQGVGEKTAIKIIVEYHSIENAYENRANLKPPRAAKEFEENFDQAKLSKELATICTSVPLEFSLDCAMMNNIYTPECYEWFKKLEFKKFLDRFSEKDVAEATNFELEVNIIDEYTAVVDYLKTLKKEKVIGFEILHEEAIPYGVVFTVHDQTKYIPIGGFIEKNWLLSQVKDILRAVKTVCVMNLKEILHFVGTLYEVDFFDAAVASYLLYPLQSEYEYNHIANDQLNLIVPDKVELLEKKKIREWVSENLEKVAYYAGMRATVAVYAMPILKQKLSETNMLSLYENIEIPLIYCLYNMEKVGVLIDQEALSDYHHKVLTLTNDLEQEIYQLAGSVFNIQSPKQLGEVLFDQLQLPNGKKTKTGYSTAADVLEKLLYAHPIVPKVLEYRHMAKLKSTYAEGLANFIAEDGRIHGKFNQTITATGRISSTEPNLQNIPVRMEIGREIRKVFIPKEGCVFIDADYSQIELRILAHLSQDKQLIQSYQQAEDIHALTAAQVFGTPIDEVTSEQRRRAKAVNFGIVYGISAFGLSEDLHITRKEASEYIARYFEVYPGVKRYLDSLIKQAKTDGYVTTLYGRIRPIPEIRSSNFNQKNMGERIAMNSPLQGTAADIMKMAAIGVEKAIREEGLHSQIVLQVHDELLIEAPKEEEDAIRRILYENMQQAAKLDVKLEIDINVGENWYEAK